MTRLFKTALFPALVAAWLVAGPGGTGIAVALRCRDAQMAMHAHGASGPCFCGAMSAALAGTVADASPELRAADVPVAPASHAPPARPASIRPRSHTRTPPTPPPLALPA